MVYGDWEKSEADEEHPLNPKDIYGTMKLAGEIVTRGLSECYQIRSTIIRPSAVYGPYDMNRRVSQIFLQKAINNEVIDVHGVDEKLDFSYVKDVAEGIALAATQEGGIDEVFNITGGQAYTLLDFVGILKRHFPNLSYNVMERDEKRPRRGKLSIAKAGSLLGYRPKYDLERGIKEYLDTCQELFTNTRR